MLFISEEDIDSLTAALGDVLNGRPAHEVKLPVDYPHKELEQLVGRVNALISRQRIHSEFALALSRGELSYDPPKGTKEHALKSLQASLRHLAWQTEEIANGRLVQRMDFMGEMSAGFNSMVDALQKAALQDVLTGLPNRRLFTDRLSHELSRAMREGHTFALLYLDLDGFKLVNDSLGHFIGDALLKDVACRLRLRVRESDTVARLGGDEFALIISHVAKAQSLLVAKELLSAFDAPFVMNGHKAMISASIGISFFPDDATNCAELLQRADNALYDAKRNGKNCFRCYTPELGLKVDERLTLETELRGAIKAGQITVDYQPEFDIASKRLVRFEALARWTHPTLGSIPPSKFIPIAEESGIIVALGAYVMSQACAEAVKWQAIAPHAVQVGVNVSNVQFAQTNFIEDVTGILDRNGLNRDLLQIEITESVMLADPDSAAEVMKHLDALGISMAIDDFGTGYSCLSYLPALPFQSIKIDRSFVKDVVTGKDSRAMIKSLIGLAHDLGRRVIIEGVEELEQFELVKGLGADEVQGFLLGHPTANPTTRLLTSLSHNWPTAICDPFQRGVKRTACIRNSTRSANDITDPVTEPVTAISSSCIRPSSDAVI